MDNKQFEILCLKLDKISNQVLLNKLEIVNLKQFVTDECERTNSNSMENIREIIEDILVEKNMEMLNTLIV